MNKPVEVIDLDEIKFQPAKNRVLVLRDEQSKFIPGTKLLANTKEQENTGIVVKQGKFTEVEQYREGARIAFHKNHNGVELEFGGKKYLLLAIDNVFGEITA